MRIPVHSREWLTNTISLVSCCLLNILAVKFDVMNVILAAILRQTGNLSLLCILSSRLLINMREARTWGPDRTIDIETTGNMKFGEIGASEEHISSLLIIDELKLSVGSSLESDAA